jgi:hypothetical protein
MPPESILLTLLCLTALFLLPGWALLSATGLWRRWATLQRWILAVAVSSAFFPVLYYLARAVLPGMHIGPHKLATGLLLCLLVTLLFQRKTWREQFAFDHWELVAIGVFAATLLVRLALAARYPFPAWSDSLHHTLLTQLTANAGQLPRTMLPYEPAVLNMYHLGLYSLTGALQLLADIPAHSALQWTAQWINGLCGLGVYFALDRLVSRRAGVIGALVVGLYSFQPNWYINWGRYTQLASQLILLVAWVATWEAVRAWKERGSWRNLAVWGLLLAAGLLNAAVFLFHFRVAGYYLPLLLVTLLYELWHSRREQGVWRTLAGIALVGLVSLALVSPAIAPSVSAYGQRSERQAQAAQADPQAAEAQGEYYAYTLNSLFLLGVRPWLALVTVLAVAVSLAFQRRLSLFLLAWMALLWLEGNAYRLNIPILNLTNFTAVMILFYLPVGLFVGIALDGLLALPRLQSQRMQRGLMSLLLLLGAVAGTQRLDDIEPFRFFVTPADVEAMAWIRENTQPDDLFAVNTYQWFGSSPHGTDGGYWIPYFTGRKTTTGSMNFGLGDADYVQRIKSLSALVVQASNDPNAIAALRDAGVDYLYLGARGSWTDYGLNVETILTAPGTGMVYNQGDVAIVRIDPLENLP